MKRKINILAILLLCLIGCKGYYQVIDTGSPDAKMHEVNGMEYFVFENDTLKIIYSFWTNRGIMSFKIYNKSKKPIYVDWRKSSFISNKDKVNYWDDDITRTTRAVYSGSSLYSQYAYKGPNIATLIGLKTTTGVMKSKETETKKERITFIPPNSNYSRSGRSTFCLLPESLGYYPINRSDNYEIVPRTDNAKTSTKVYKMGFDRENTPFRFRNFITYSTTEDFKEEYYVDNEFYVKSIVEMRDKHFFGRIIEKNIDYTSYDTPFLKSTAFYLEIPKDLSNMDPGFGYK